MSIKGKVENKSLRIRQSKVLNKTTISLPASKSESNRMLILNGLSGGKSLLHNLSEARDTITMQRLLKDKGQKLNVLDAGTTMRFLTAYFSVTNQNKILTGTPRMCERPVKILVEALKAIGAEIVYLEKEGYPPIHIKGFKSQESNRIKIRGDVSSQYISALIMIAPVLKEGLTLALEGKISSKPYIEMTLGLMGKFGLKSSWDADTIIVKPQSFNNIEYTIESDWSGASYWYGFVALAGQAEIKLAGLRKDSLQGDIIIADMMEKLGVKTRFLNDGVLLSKKGHLKEVSFDFTDCPDLAQTIAVVCAAKGVSCEMSGLESLQIKETDRIQALKNELKKIGAKLEEYKPSHWGLTTATKAELKPMHINTYDDHRMAMAFAPLATLTDISIEKASVVEKSYPGFWKDMEKAGFELAFSG